MELMLWVNLGGAPCITDRKSISRHIDHSMTKEEIVSNTTKITKYGWILRANEK